jgi:hypothetical protein
VRTLSSVPKPNRYAKDDADQPEEEAKPELTKEQGLNRIVWDLRYDGSKRLAKAKIDSGDPDHGPLALPGKYTLKLIAAGQTYSTEAEVKADPHSPVAAEQLKQNFAFALEARAALDRLVGDIDAVRGIREQADEIKKRTAANAAAKELQATADSIVKRCDQIELSMHNPQAEVVYDVLAGREGGAKLYSQIAPLFSDIQSSDYAPTQGQRQQLDEDLAELQTLEAQVASMRSGDLARLEAQANALKLPHVIVPGAQ